MDYSTIIYIIFGLLPSLTWLFYYLTKDLHPEPKRMILRVFFWGALITLPVFFIQIGLTSLLNGFNPDPLIYSLVYWFFIISFSEELFKYLVIKLKVVNSPNLDEPLDIMLYMVVAALGFAAVENILYLLSPIGQMAFDQLMSRTLVIAFIRFVGATFLHTLCSAIIGYSLAISFCEVKFKKTILVGGIFLATLLHGLYDFSIMTLAGNIKFIVPIIVIVILAVLVFLGFEKLKRMRGICKLR